MRAVAAALLLAGSLPIAAPARAADGEEPACFAETALCVQGRFLAYWRRHGGLAVFGCPLTEEEQEPTGLTTTMTVQYFERMRLEYHPEHAGTPYAVQPTRLGA